MKAALILLLLCTFACGKKNSSGPEIGTYREELSQRPAEYARDFFEVRAILADAAQRGFLEQFHNTKWYTHRGQFLCRSVVIDAHTYKLAMQ
jgi:hypothetical protein